MKQGGFSMQNEIGVAPGFQVYDLKVDRWNEYAIVERPKDFSWKMKSDRLGSRQVAYRLQILDEETIIWDTDRVESNQTIQISYEGPELSASTEYSVNVYVWDEQGRMAMTESRFETGLREASDMPGSWITHGELFLGKEPQRSAIYYFEKHFEVKKQVKKAKVYATAKGIYDLQVDGEKIGTQYLAPGWTNYKKRLQYQIYDVILSVGTHTLTVACAEGWYKGYLGFTCGTDTYGDRVEVLAALHIIFEDGEQAWITTDDRWTVRKGAHTFGDLYMGETIDFTNKDVQKEPVIVVGNDKSKLILQESEPVREIDRLPVKEYFISPTGEHILDFGQNMSGVVEVCIRGRHGQKITLWHGETLNEKGNFYRENLGAALAKDVFVCSGERVYPVGRETRVIHSTGYASGSF